MSPLRRRNGLAAFVLRDITFPTDGAHEPNGQARKPVGGKQAQAKGGRSRKHRPVADHRDGLDAAAPPERQRLFQQGDQIARDEQRKSARQSELCKGVLAPIGIERGDTCPNSKCCKGIDQHRRAIGQQKADPGARNRAEPTQHARCLLNSFMKLTIRRRPAAEAQRRAVCVGRRHEFGACADRA